MKKGAAACYRHRNLLYKVSQINDPEISLRSINDAHLLSLLKPFCAKGFDHARGTIYVTNIATTTCSDACEGAPSSTPCDLDEAASVVFLNERHRLRELPDLQKAANVA